MRKLGFWLAAGAAATAAALALGAAGCRSECKDCPEGAEGAAAAATPGAPAAGGGGALAALAGGAATAPVPAGLKKAVFNVEGMTCEGCATGVMAALKGIDGVANAGVEFSAKEAWAVYKDVPEATLLAAIEKHGYKASVKSVTGG